MQTIKEHIKTNNYKPCYLLYGTESYLKRLYRDKLKNGILCNSDDMNYSYFEGKAISIEEIVSIAQTLPFFSERRLLVIENSGLFKTQSSLADAIKEFPNTTCLVFVEEEIDKRNKLYKIVKELGVVSQMDGLDEKNLKLWIVSILKAENKKITEETILYLLEQTGSSMEQITRELEKIICYAIDREVITQDDIDAVGTTQVTNQIFQMIDAIVSKNPRKAFLLYHDLLTIRERAMSIFFLLTRHINLLLQVKELEQLKKDKTLISKKTGIPPFAVKKYSIQTSNFSTKRLVQLLEKSMELECDVKTGKLLDQLAVELLLVELNKK